MASKFIPEKGYDPRRALLGMREGMKQLKARQKAERAPSGLVDANGQMVAAPTEAPKPSTYCFLLLAFAHGSPMMAEDFHNVPKNGAGLKAHTRPDGGVYLGTFELPKDPGGAVVVFGDPDMSREEAAASSLAFRQQFLDFVQHQQIIPTAS